MSLSARTSPHDLDLPFEDLADDFHDHDHPVKADGSELPRFFHDRALDSMAGFHTPPRYHRRMSFWLEKTADGGAAFDFRPLATGYAPQSRILFFQGYMQGPLAGIADKVLDPLMPFMNDHRTRGLSYAHGNRGTSRVLTRQGRSSVQDIQDDIATDLQGINARCKRDHGDLPTILMGHSQGGQHVAHILKDPKRYGFTEDQIRGVILMNPMLLPHSQTMLATPGFLTDIALRSLGSVAASLCTGKGILFRGKKAFDAFLGEGDPDGKAERRITECTFPDSGAFFVQSLTTGTSPSLKDARIQGLPISMVVSQDDQLMGQTLQHKTADYLASLGAKVHLENVPGKHFAPIVTHTGEGRDRVDATMAANRRAYAHVFQSL